MPISTRSKYASGEASPPPHCLANASTIEEHNDYQVKFRKELQERKAQRLERGTNNTGELQGVGEALPRVALGFVCVCQYLFVSVRIAVPTVSLSSTLPTSPHLLSMLLCAPDLQGEAHP